MNSCVGWKLHEMPQADSSLLIHSISPAPRHTFFHIVTSLGLRLVL